MPSISLFFESEDSTLARVEYLSDPGRASIISIRGSGASTVKGAGSFTWSGGVQALCLLLLRYKCCLGDEHSLSGSKGSAAASLDYALSKPPTWLLEMFGANASGEARARSLFRRENPERKRPGPVSIHVNHHLLTPDSINIFVSGQSVTNLTDIQLLRERHEKCWSERNPVKRDMSALQPHSIPFKLHSLDFERFDSATAPRFDIKNALADWYLREAHQVLSSTNVFSRSGIRDLKTRSLANASFNRIAGEGAGVLAQIDDELLPSERLGLTQHSDLVESLYKGPPIEVALSPAHVGSLLIFMYLRDVYQFPITINFRFAHSVETAKRMINRAFNSPPTICSLTIATTATVLGRGSALEYLPFMFAPNMTHALVADQSVDQDSNPNGEYLLMRDIPATESFVYDELLERGIISSKLSEVRDAEPDEVGEELRQHNRDLRAIIGFPHYVFQVVFNHAHISHQLAPASLSKETLLFSHVSLNSQPDRLRALKVLIRDVWLRLRSDPICMRKMISLLFQEPEYIDFVTRITGVQLDSHP